ncbi:MAG TPA: radical SAM protein [Chitinophagales bacterium]|nr:radical SAM protein [Chitinophagales bacterium]
MVDVFIANAYFLKFDPKQERAMQPYPPLGTLYVAAVLQHAGYNVTFSDTVFAKSASEIFPVIETHNNGIVIICDDGFNYLTKMCLVNMRNACFELIRYAKENNCKVIVSSSDATDHWKEYLETGADYIVIGEAEKTISELVDYLHDAHSQKEISNIQGIAFKTVTGFEKTIVRTVMHDLDALPYPAWELADIEKYKIKWLKKNGYFSLNITTTRGCPFKCNWCAKPIYGNRYNARSAENVVNEIAMLIETYQVTHFWFCDDIFGLKPGWIKQFSELVQQRNLKFKFKIQCRADLLLNEQNIESLAVAGCDEVWIGAESGSQKILDAMDKGTTIQQIYDCTMLMKKHNIKPCFFLQFGYPGETKTDIDATIKMLFDLMPYDIGISVSYPLPGTKFYESVKSELRQKQNWNDSDELALMFRSTYPPEFYKELHRYVHKKFRSAQGLMAMKKILQLQSPEIKHIKRMAAIPYFRTSAFLHKRKMELLQK